jgi:hypothetical protein
MEATDKKHCIECKRPLLGRADKRFCDDVCRNSFNNRRNSETSNYMRVVNNALRKNRKILEEIYLGKPTLIDRWQLLERGYSFAFCTGMEWKKKGMIFYCYEYLIMVINEEKVSIRRKKLVSS